MKHGTYAASMRHRREDSPLCEPCRLARNEYCRDRRRREGRGRTYSLAYNRAEGRALARLRDARRAEYEQYLDDELGKALREAS